MVAWDELRDRVNADPEFQLAARFWTAGLRLDMDADSMHLNFVDGELEGVERCDPSSACDLFITASKQVWSELLAETPRPYYQDLSAAQIHHGLRLPKDQLSYAAYYPALRRLVQLMSATGSSKSE